MLITCSDPIHEQDLRADKHVHLSARKIMNRSLPFIVMSSKSCVDSTWTIVNEQDQQT
jgi:hypothetical protein